LVGNQLGRLGKGYHNDSNAAPVKFIFERLHLDEVGLARQSGKMPEKN
jgi:hypothetical protein